MLNTIPIVIIDMSQTVEPTRDNLIDKIDFSIKSDGFKPYFEDDKEPRNCYIVTLKYNGKKISFTYGDSIANSEAGLKPKKNVLLEIVTSDFYINKENYPSYEDFAPEFGYDVDSIKGLRTYENCMKQGEKLQKLFDEDEIKNLREELEL